MYDGLTQLGEFLEKADGGSRPDHKYTQRSGNPGNYQYTYAPLGDGQSQPLGQTNTGEPIHGVERGPHSVDAWGEVLVGKTTPGHEQEAPNHLEHDGKHWIRAGYNTDSNTVGYHEYQPARHLMDPTTGFAREAVPVDAKGVPGGVFHVAGLPEHGGGSLPSEINDPHHGKLTVRGFNSDSGMTLYHKDVHNPGWNKPGSTGEANGKATPPGAAPSPQAGQNAPVAPPIRGALPQGGQPPAAQPGPPTVGGQPGKPPMPPTTGPQTAPKPPLPGGPGAQQPPATGQQQMKPGGSPQMPLVGQGQPPRPPMAGAPQASPQGQPGAQAMPPKPPMPGQPPATGQIPGQPGKPPVPAGMKPPMAGPAGSPPAGIQPAGPKPMTPPGTPPPMGRQTGGVPSVPPKPGQPAQAAAMKPPVPGAPPAPPVKPAVGAKKNPFKKSMGLDDLGDWMEKAMGGERSGHKYIKREGVTGHYQYTYAEGKKEGLNSPNENQLRALPHGVKLEFTGPGSKNKGDTYTRHGDGWHGGEGKLDHTAMAAVTFGHPITVHHPDAGQGAKAKGLPLKREEVDAMSIGATMTNGTLRAQRKSATKWQVTFPDGRIQEASHSRMIPSKDETPWHLATGGAPVETEKELGKVAKQGADKAKAKAKESYNPKDITTPEHQAMYEKNRVAEMQSQERHKAKADQLHTQGAPSVSKTAAFHTRMTRGYDAAVESWEHAKNGQHDEAAISAQAAATEFHQAKDYAPDDAAHQEAQRNATQYAGHRLVHEKGHEWAKENKPGYQTKKSPQKVLQDPEKAPEKAAQPDAGKYERLPHENAKYPHSYTAEEAHASKNAAQEDIKNLGAREDLSPDEEERLGRQHLRAMAAHTRLRTLASTSDEKMEHSKMVTYHHTAGNRMMDAADDRRKREEKAAQPKKEPKAAKPQQLNLFGKSLTGLHALGDYLEKSEKIPGGLAAGKGPKDFDSQALAQGQKVELEHTDNAQVAREIAMDHLTEDPHYYTKLAKMEAEKVEKCGVTKALPGRGATEKCMNKAMNGLEALSGYLSKSLEDPMPDEKCELGYGKSREVGESPDGGDIDGKGASRSMEGRVGDAHGGAGGQKADVGGAPSLDKDKLNKEERDPEDQMSPGQTAIEVSEKSLTPAGQRSMVAREHALKVQELTKSEDVQVGVPDHPYMMSSMGDVDTATEGLLKSEFYQGDNPALSQPGTILRKSVLCKSGACGISYPAFYTACPECGNGQTTNRLMPHSHEIGGEGPTRMEKSKNDPILQPRPQEDDLMVGAPENVVLFRTRR